MTKENRQDVIKEAVQSRFRTFNRIEKVFFLSFLATILIISTSTIYLHSRNQEIEQEISSIKNQVYEKEVELNNAKQEINELTRLERIAQIAEKYGLQTQNGNLEKAD